MQVHHHILLHKYGSQLNYDEIHYNCNHHGEQDGGGDTEGRPPLLSQVVPPSFRPVMVVYPL
jgi:hypothetical protein